MLPVELFIDFIAQNNLFNHHNKILAAVSGGMDSVVMVHLLNSAGFNFGIAHCNFQLRGDESNNDEAFCRQLAQLFRVPFYTTSFETSSYAGDKKISTQMAARELRYQWFEQVREQSGYDVISLAHHQNDTIETILLNLVRGTGIAGLHGILPKNRKLVRPMLFLNRDEIESLVKENAISFVEDSSNSSTKYSRNKIRLEVVPKLKELNPALEQTFEKNLLYFKEMELLLMQQVAKLKGELFEYHGDEIQLSIEGLKKIEPKRLLFFNLLYEYGFNETVIEDLILSLEKHSGRVFESQDFTMLLDRDKLIIKKKAIIKCEPLLINPNDREVNYGSYKLNVLHDDSPLIVKNNPMALSVDTEKLVFPLTLRPWQQGDYFYPIGMKTRKKVSDFFIGQKIPLTQKSEVPLLINGNGDIIWIGGYRPDERFKVTENTKKVTIFELLKL